MASNVKLDIDFGTFDAAHQLPGHNGKCKNLHGHTYRVKCTLEGPVIQTPGEPDEGMVIDFSQVKSIYKERIHEVLDHSLILGTTRLPWIQQLMDDVFYDVETVHQKMQDFGVGKVALLPITVTTAENMAQWMANTLGFHLDWARRDTGNGDPVILSVTVYETPTAGATAQYVWPSKQIQVTE